MLHTQTVLPSTLELLNKLMDDSMLRNFVLVGGTSLALQLGHRLSVDLDLFINTSFEEQRLAEYLISEYDEKFSEINRYGNGFPLPPVLYSTFSSIL